MARQTFAGGEPFIVPAMSDHGTAVPGYSNLLMDATAEKVAFVFYVPKTGILDKFEFNLGTVTQAPTNGLKCSFQDVDTVTTGDPDGTADQYRVVTAGLTSGAWVAPGLMTSDGTDGGTKRSVTRGGRLCAVIEFESFAAGDSLNIAALAGQANSSPTGMCFSDHFTAAWAKVANALPTIALKYNDGTYMQVGPLALPASAISTHTFNNASAADEIALRFQFPFPVQVCGFWMRVDIDNAADVILYDGDDDAAAALASISLSSVVRPATAGQQTIGFFSTDHTIPKDTYYRLALKAQSVSNISTYSFTVASQAILGGCAGGDKVHYSSRADGGAWTDVQTQRPYMGLLINAFDDAAVSGGLLRHPGMAGGLV